MMAWKRWLWWTSTSSVASGCSSVGEHLPELEPWLSGDLVTSDRGAGEGEPEGARKAALTIGQAMRRARADFESAGVLCPGALWRYIDDGQLVVHNTKVDCILWALDRRLEGSWGLAGLEGFGSQSQGLHPGRRGGSVPWLVHGPHRRHVRGDLRGGSGEQGVGCGA